MSKLSKAKGCFGGILLGSALRALLFILNGLIKLIVSIMVFFGLWAPFFYALLGCILYLLFKFDPLSGSIDSKIYLAGFAGSLLCALLITIKNIFERPGKSIAEGFRKPIWEKHEEEDRDSDREEDPHRRRRRDTECEDRREDHCRGGYLSRHYEDSRPHYDEEAEKESGMPKQRSCPMPKIYYSALEKDTLVHEYEDRFEVFRIRDGRPILDKVEYKNL
jgi:hypothetical protein